MTELQNKVLLEIKISLGQIPEVKSIIDFQDTIHVFYQMDSDIESNKQNGISDMINQEVLKIKQSADELGIVTESDVVFSSIQTLNENLSKISREIKALILPKKKNQPESGISHSSG